MIRSNDPRRPRRSGWGAWIALVLALASPTMLRAQTPGVGDLLVAGTSATQLGQILRVRKGDGAVSTFFRSRGFPEIVQSIAMADDNQTWFVALQNLVSQSGQVLRLFSPTRWTTLRSFPNGDGPQAMTVDQDGSLLVTTAGGRLLRLTSNGQTTTLYNGTVLLNAVATDPVTGHAVVAEFTGGPARLILIDTARAVVLGSQPAPLVRALTPVSRKGGLLLGTPATGVGLWRGGTVSLFSTVPMGNALAVAEDGSVFGAGGTTPNQVIYQVDTAGMLVGTIDVSSSMLVVRDLLVHGSRALRGRGPVRAGTWFEMDLTSANPADAGRPFVVLPSFGTYPGLGLGPGKFIAVNPDFLTELALRGSLTSILSGAFGTLNASRTARIRLRIGAGLNGVRVYLAGVVLDLGQPGPQIFSTMTNTVVVNFP